jgi:Zn ribbon nucleic-acid-binding protein
MQQTLVGCAFCDAPPGTETVEAHTWWQDKRVTHPICVDCAIQTEPDSRRARSRRL